MEFSKRENGTGPRVIIDDPTKSTWTYKQLDEIFDIANLTPEQRLIILASFPDMSVVLSTLLRIARYGSEKDKDSFVSAYGEHLQEQLFDLEEAEQ